MTRRTCLVVRPEPGCGATLGRVNALPGWRGAGVPLTERLATNAPMPDEAFDAVVVTSAAAASLLHALQRDVPMHAIGRATAMALKEAGFPNVTVGADGTAARDGGALGRALARSGRYRTVLYPCTRDRRPDLERDARDGGLRIVPWPIYATVAVPDGTARLRAALDSAPDAVLLHAPSGAAALGASWPVDWARGRTLALCLSDAIAAAVPRGFAAAARVAERPEDAALIDLLARE